MKPAPFPVETLPAWCERYGAEVHGIRLADVEGRGNGWIAQEDLESDGENGGQCRPLLVIPTDVIASYGLVMQYATENTRFSQLVHAVQFKVRHPAVMPVLYEN